MCLRYKLVYNVRDEPIFRRIILIYVFSHFFFSICMFVSFSQFIREWALFYSWPVLLLFVLCCLLGWWWFQFSPLFRQLYGTFALMLTHFSFTSTFRLVDGFFFSSFFWPTFLPMRGSAGMLTLIGPNANIRVFSVRDICSDSVHFEMVVFISL